MSRRVRETHGLTRTFAFFPFWLFFIRHWIDLVCLGRSGIVLTTHCDVAVMSSMRFFERFYFWLFSSSLFDELATSVRLCLLRDDLFDVLLIFVQHYIDNWEWDTLTHTHQNELALVVDVLAWSTLSYSGSMSGPSPFFSGCVGRPRGQRARHTRANTRWMSLAGLLPALDIRSVSWERE